MCPHHSYYWELLITLKKQVLVGWLSLSFFRPGNPIQLLVAIVGTLFYLMLVGWVQPFRRPGLNFLAVVSSASLQFIFLAFLSFELSDQYGIALEGPVHDAIFSTGVLFVLALGVLFVATFARHALFDRPRTPHWVHNDEEVKLRRLHPGNYHAFISHAWRSGQDQSKTIKLALEALLPRFLACAQPSPHSLGRTLPPVCFAHLSLAHFTCALPHALVYVRRSGCGCRARAPTRQRDHL